MTFEELVKVYKQQVINVSYDLEELKRESESTLGSLMKERDDAKALLKKNTELMDMYKLKFQSEQDKSMRANAETL
jgi:hypothetical protein